MKFVAVLVGVAVGAAQRSEREGRVLRGPPLLNAPPNAHTRSPPNASPPEIAAPPSAATPAPTPAPTPAATTTTTTTHAASEPRNPSEPQSSSTDELVKGLPVPDAVRAISVLCVGYFSVHVLLSVGAALDCYGRDVLSCMEDLRGVVAEAPMLGAVMLALNMQISRKSGNDLPAFVRIAMEVVAVIFLLRIGATVFYYAEDQEMSHKAQVGLACLGYGLLVMSVAGTAMMSGLTAAFAIATIILGLAQCTMTVMYELSRLSTSTENKPVKVLHTALHTLSPAAMLAVAFLAVELQRDANHPPTARAKISIYVSSFALLAATLLVLVAQLLAGQRVGVHVALENKFAAVFIKVSTTVSMVTMFVAYSVLLYEVLNGPMGPMGISAALTNLIVLSFLFFGVYLASFLRVTLGSPEAPGAAALFSARRGVVTAPMVGVIIVAARMRALDLNPEGGPPGWCMDAMYVATFGVAVSLVASFARKAVEESDSLLATVSSNSLTTLALLLLFGGILTILGSLFTMRKETCTGTGSVFHHAFTH